MMTFLYLLFVNVFADLATLRKFDVNTDVVSQVAKGNGIGGFSYIGPPSGPGILLNNTIRARVNATLALDLVHGQMFLDSGNLGRVWFLPNATYVTTVNSGIETCFVAAANWSFEAKTFGLMNEKNRNVWLRNNESDHPLLLHPVTIWNGMAADNTQCNTSHPYEWLVGNGNWNDGLIYSINADTPLDVPSALGIATNVIPQNYNFWSWSRGVPSASYFVLPSICWNPLNWCEVFFSRGLIPTYSTL
jgi:hypothetical protein